MTGLGSLFYSFVITCVFFGRHFLITGPPANAFYYNQTLNDYCFILSIVCCFFIFIYLLLFLAGKYLNKYFYKILFGILAVSLLPLLDLVFMSLLRVWSSQSIIDSGITGFAYVLLTFLCVPFIIFISIKTGLEKYVNKIVSILLVLSLLIIFYAIPRYFGVLHVENKFVKGSKTPVHIMIFDGMSYEILNSPELRIKFPNFSKLAESSFMFKNAYSPGPHTILSVPSLLTGIEYASVREEYSRLFISKSSSEKYLNLPVGNSIFHLAKMHGYNTILLGDALPYCNIFGNDLTYGISFSSYYRLSQVLPLPFDAIFNMNVSYRRDKTLRLIDEYHSKIDAAPQNSLFYTHLLLPHEPYIFDANGLSYSRWDYIFRHAFMRVKFKDDDERYINQLIYADKKLGEIVDRLKKNNSYDSALLVVTADHNFRLKRFDNQDMRKVPLYIKMPFQKEGRVVKDKCYLINLKQFLSAFFDSDIVDISFLFRRR